MPSLDIKQEMIKQETIDDVSGLHINLGHRSTTTISISFIDQNGITHRRFFEFQVFGEKPTWFYIRDKDDDDKTIYASSSNDKI
jgi:hypothetical protein